MKAKAPRQKVKQSDLEDGVEIGGQEVSLSVLHDNYQIKENDRVVIMFPSKNKSLSSALLYFEGAYGVEVVRDVKPEEAEDGTV